MGVLGWAGKQKRGLMQRMRDVLRGAHVNNIGLKTAPPLVGIPKATWPALGVWGKCIASVVITGE